MLFDILFIVLIIIIIALAVLYYFNRKNMGKMVQAQDFIEQNKVLANTEGHICPRS